MPSLQSIGPVQSAVKSEPISEADQLVFEATKKYIGLHFRVLPFVRGKGICYLNKDQETNFMCAIEEVEEKFAGNDIGIDVHESGLVDFDVDCIEPIPFINWLLPQTMTIGRSDKPISHLLYKRIGELKTIHFADIDGKEMLALLTSNRLALPPSIHGKSGEALYSTLDCEPAEIGPDVLNVLGEIAALALITRYWPPKHARHDVSLALAGTLVRAGWPVEKARKAVVGSMGRRNTT
jgi:hypothetical protein